MRALVLVTLTALSALEIGCQKSDPPAAASTTSAPAEAASAPAVAAEVPTPEDYEAKTEKAIASTATPGVLTQELDKLEKEIGK